MGNWIKGRVLINDVSVIPDNTQHNHANQVGVANSAQSYHHHQHHNHQSELIPPSSLYYSPPYSSALLQFATEEEQIQLAKRIGLIQHLPTGTYDGNGSTLALRECVICMVEFSKGDSIRFLPCLHTYHVHCIDDWLMRSFICPSCMEPVDVALLNTL